MKTVAVKAIATGTAVLVANLGLISDGKMIERGDSSRNGSGRDGGALVLKAEKPDVPSRPAGSPEAHRARAGVESQPVREVGQAAEVKRDITDPPDDSTPGDDEGADSPNGSDDPPYFIKPGDDPDGKNRK